MPNCPNCNTTIYLPYDADPRDVPYRRFYRCHKPGCGLEFSTVELPEAELDELKKLARRTKAARQSADLLRWAAIRR